MIPGFARATQAIELFIEKYPHQIISFDKHQILPRVKIVLEGNILLYIRYNDYGEYSYQLIFSNKTNDGISFDNYDEHWDIDTQPNHKHVRYEDKVIESPMCGDPDIDIPILVQEIEENQI